MRQRKRSVGRVDSRIAACFLVALAGCFSCDRVSSENTALSETLELPGFNERSAILAIDIPIGFGYEVDKGVDFIVHRLTSPSGSTQLGIYVGNHPSTFIEDEGEDWSSLSGHVDEREVVWKMREHKEAVFAETLVDRFLIPGHGFEGPFIFQDSRLHLFVSAGGKADMEAGLGFFDSLRLQAPAVSRSSSPSEEAKLNRISVHLKKDGKVEWKGQGHDETLEEMLPTFIQASELMDEVPMLTVEYDPEVSRDAFRDLLELIMKSLDYPYDLKMELKKSK